MVAAVDVGMGGAEAEAAMRLPGVDMGLRYMGFGSLFESARLVSMEGSAAAVELWVSEREMTVDMRFGPQDLSGNTFLRL